VVSALSRRARAALGLFALAAACLLPGLARSQDMGTCTVINQLPYTITASGYYCLQNDLTSTGSGIMVNASDVVIDLGGNTLRGPGTNNTITYCVLAFGRARIKVRNGTIRGCAYGLYISDFADSAMATGFLGGYHRVEDLRITHCTFRGMRIEGNGNVVRNVDLRFIGGDLVYPSSSAIAIESLGPGARIIGNTIHEVRGGGPGDTGLGLAISLSRMSSGSIIQGNTLSNSSIDPVAPFAVSWPATSRTSLGIWLGATTTGVLIEGNLLSNYQVGVSLLSEARALLARNTVSGTARPYEMSQALGFGAGNLCDVASCLFLIP